MSIRLWFYSILAVGFTAVQAWLDLTLPDYMSAITTLVETEGSSMMDILVQGGFYCDLYNSQFENGQSE